MDLPTVLAFFILAAIAVTLTALTLLDRKPPGPR